ncbi:MAG TPA: hypothetical protein VJ123_10320 [Anaerolineales bacterium]|nr:hypothetical protein [Anaerolineales bacterium]
MTRLLDRLRIWLSGSRRAPFAVSPSSLAVLGRQIATTQEVEYACDDVYRLLDQFAEAVLRGDNTAPWMPLIRAHLDRCPDCRAEFEALMQALRSPVS